jgi:hypothetical protein
MSSAYCSSPIGTNRTFVNVKKPVRSDNDFYRLTLTNARNPPDVNATGGSLVAKVEDLLPRTCSRSHRLPN